MSVVRFAEPWIEPNPRKPPPFQPASHDAVETIVRDTVADFLTYGYRIAGEIPGYSARIDEYADNVSIITKQYGDCEVTVKYFSGGDEVATQVSDAYVNLIK